MSQLIAALSVRWHTTLNFGDLVVRMNDYCLVLVKFGIVAKDIAATLEERCLGVPLISQCEKDALEKISGLGATANLRLAIIQGDRALISQGACIVPSRLLAVPSSGCRTLVTRQQMGKISV